MTADPAADLVLEVRDLRTHFFTPEGVVRAVDGATFNIRRGKTLCIVGESGCGKSITARSLLKVVDAPGRIVSGDILFRPRAGQTSDIGRMAANSAELRAIRGKDISMIFQEPMSAFSPLYTVGNQITEALRWHAPVTKAEARARAIEALARVGIPRPQELIDAYTYQLSGGMRQRAMIAMALICDPLLLIADEPTTALDVTTQAVILDLMRDLQRDLGMSMMFITHDLGVVAEIADEVAVMYLGQIVELGAVEAIFSSPKHPYTRALLRSIPRLGAGRSRRLDVIRGMVPHPLLRPQGCAFHTRCDLALKGICDQSAPPTFTQPDGSRVSCHLYAEGRSMPALEAGAPSEAAPTPAPDAGSVRRSGRKMLAVDQLKVHFPITRGFFRRTVGWVKAVDGVSLDIYEGETLGLVGESGCGKTTLGQTVARLYQPVDGRIWYADGTDQPTDLAHLKNRALKPYRRHIRMIFQDPYASLNPRLPVLEIVGEILTLSGVPRGAELERRVRELLLKVGLRPEYIRRYPHAFSGGERQRISIARALAPMPRLVIADEAVSALDVSVRAQILNLLADLQAEFGLTYLFISHDLSVVAHISDRVAVMYTGKIVELAPTGRLFAAPQHPYTEALLSAVLKPEPHNRRANGRIRLEGEVPDPAHPPSGCAFHPRCRYAQARCKTDVPALREMPGGAFVACHFAETLSLAGIPSFDQPVRPSDPLE